MRSRVFVIRPEPGFAETMARGAAMGLSMGGEPLFAIEPVAWTLPPRRPDALLIGSGNALRHGGAALAELRNVPVFAVGESTAALARAAGFDVAQTGEGALQGLLDSLPAAPGATPVRMLRLGGEARVAVTPPPHVEIVERIAYRSVPLEMSAPFRDTMTHGGTVLLHSAVAARHFAAQCDTHGVTRAGLRLALIGPRLRDAAGGGWAAIAIAATPSDAALLALA